VPGELAIVTRHLSKDYYTVSGRQLAVRILLGAVVGLVSGWLTAAVTRDLAAAVAVGVLVDLVLTVVLLGVRQSHWLCRNVTAVEDLNLSIERGEVFGLLGPNGSGKSTTIKMLLGLIASSKGEAEVLGRPPGDLSAKQRIGYLPEETHLYRFLNSVETLDFYGRLFRIPRQVRRRRTAELLDLVGLGADVRKRKLKTYSKGQLRRIGVAQALINDPELLLLDEPTSGLDPIGRIEMKKLIADLKARGRTVLITSHLLADMEALCDRVLILHQGATVVTGRTSLLLADEQSYQMTASGVDDSVMAEVAELIRSRGGQVSGTEHPRASLEEFFREQIERRRAAVRGESRGEAD